MSDVQPPVIHISRETDDWPSRERLRGLVEKAVTTTGDEAGLAWPEHAELSLLYTGDAHMAEINGKWRGVHEPTNVLSFPGADISAGEPAGQVIGDMVFAFETVSREADAQGKRFEDHLTHLTVHGFLHLFGYDHLDESEAEAMEALEMRTLYGLGIGDPYA